MVVYYNPVYWSPVSPVATAPEHLDWPALQKKDSSVTFWAERIFFCHTYDTSMTIIVTKPGIIIDVVGSYFYDKKS